VKPIVRLMTLTGDTSKCDGVVGLNPDVNKMFAEQLGLRYAFGALVHDSYIMMGGVWERGSTAPVGLLAPRGDPCLSRLLVWLAKRRWHRRDEFGSRPTRLGHHNRNCGIKD
jgi:hypothetical protein